MDGRRYALRFLVTPFWLFLLLKIEETYTFMAISGAEILRDLNISSKCSVEAIKNTKSRLSLIVWVNVVMNRTVVVDSDWRFDNLCGRHVQSQSELMVLYYGYWSDWSITSRCYRVVCQLAVITSQLNLRLLWKRRFYQGWEATGVGLESTNGLQTSFLEITDISDRLGWSGTNLENRESFYFPDVSQISSMVGDHSW